MNQNTKWFILVSLLGGTAAILTYMESRKLRKIQAEIAELELLHKKELAQKRQMDKELDPTKRFM